jgi:hypothetical protein
MNLVCRIRRRVSVSWSRAAWLGRDCRLCLHLRSWLGVFLIYWPTGTLRVCTLGWTLPQASAVPPHNQGNGNGKDCGRPHGNARDCSCRDGRAGAGIITRTILCSLSGRCPGWASRCSRPCTCERSITCQRRAHGVGKGSGGCTSESDLGRRCRELAFGHIYAVALADARFTSRGDNSEVTARAAKVATPNFFVVEHGPNAVRTNRNVFDSRAAIIICSGRRNPQLISQLIYGQGE